MNNVIKFLKHHEGEIAAIFAILNIIFFFIVCFIDYIKYITLEWFWWVVGIEFIVLVEIIYVIIYQNTKGWIENKYASIILSTLLLFFSAVVLYYNKFYYYH